MLKRTYIAVLLVGLQSVACGSQSPVDANSGAATSPSTASSAGSGSTAPSAHSTQASSSSASTSKPATSTSNTAASSSMSTASSQPATTQTGSSTTSAAGSGGSSAGAPKGDVPSETASAAGSKGSDAAAGASGAMSAAAGSGGDAAGEPKEDFGKGDGSDVVTIGDSWMSIATNGGGIEGGLDRAGTKYRHYSVAGTTLLTGQIPGQYDQAKAQNPNIKTIIMTGGGNDVMFSGGCNTKEACTQFSQMIADGLDMLWMRAQKDGVTGAVYIQYSRNAGTAPADTRPDHPAVPKICSDSKFRCVFIGTTDLIAATDTVDGIHPTFDGCDRIAKRTLEEMEKAGVRR